MVSKLLLVLYLLTMGMDQGPTILKALRGSAIISKWRTLILDTIRCDQLLDPIHWDRVYIHLST